MVLVRVVKWFVSFIIYVYYILFKFIVKIRGISTLFCTCIVVENHSLNLIKAISCHIGFICIINLLI